MQTLESSELDRLWTQELYREFNEVLVYYRLQLPRPVIVLTDDTARYGSYDSLLQKLTISRKLIELYSWDVVLEVLKHEMAHILADSMGSDDPHGPTFQKACERLGVAPWARQARIEIDPAQALQAHRTLTEEQERLLRRVEKLLSLAGSQETHEATLAMERARELILRHQLETFVNQKEEQYTYVLIEHRKKQIPAHQSAIASLLCNHFFVDCITRSLYHAQDRCSYKVLEIAGTRENVQMAEYVYWFLWNQLPLLWKHHKKGLSQAASRLSQRSFYLGVLHGFRHKLTLQKEELEQRTQSWGLEVSAQQCHSITSRAHKNLQAFLRSRYPFLERRSRGGTTLTREDFTSGQARGRELNLHRGLTQGHTGSVRLLGPSTSRS